ncbi:MAG: T9SS type A sorting domain-containing protein [Bacteroidota bacterium]|nr:T9SS type A sorting domain-containing protein [Bacteroidota bacterium]
MKKIIFSIIIALFFGQKAKCQVDTLAEAKKELINILSHLDKSKIPTGMLMDRTLHPITLANFDGDSDEVISSARMSYLHSKLNEMSVNGSALISYDSMLVLANDMDKQNINPIIIYNYRFNYIKDDAFTNHSLDTSNGYLEDVVGNNVSPYAESRIFTGTPRFCSSGSDTSVSFYLGKEFLLTNNLADSSNIQIDFGDGQGYRTMALGATFTINFPNQGVFNGDIKLYDAASGVTFHTRIILHIAGKLSSLPFSPQYADIKASIAFKNLYAEGLYVYTFGKGNTSGCFKKPLIFVDGIDFGTPDRPHGATDRPCINGKCGNLGYIDIATGWYNGMVNATQTAIVSQDPRWGEFQLGPTLLEKLHNEGYDVVFLDFKDGATYMQANAMVLVELINYINANKCSKDELVVLGASMGGQVTRYALSYMEKKNMKHCVRSSVYFDSPHKGSNIPISVQLFMQYFTKYNTDNLFADAVSTYKHKLTRPAAFQLLNNSPEGTTSSNGAAYGPHQLRLDFMNDLTNNLGSYPKYIRRVAVSNGSGVGTYNGIANESTLAELKIPYSTNWLATGWAGQDNIFKGIMVGLWRSALYIPAIVFNGGAIKSEMKATSGAGSGRYRIFMGDANRWKNKLEVDWNNSINPGYENAPGGLNDAVKSFNALAGIGGNIKLQISKANFASSCFIPTNSSLALLTNDLYASAKNETQNSDYPNRSKYAFDAYYAPSSQYEYTSQLHVQMTNSNINWLIMELRRTCNQLSTLPKKVNYMDANEVSYSQTCNTYNFGTHFRHILNDIEVNSDGILQVNKYDFVNYKIAGDDWNKRDEQNFKNTSFELYTSNCGSEVSINNGGTFTIGDNNNIPNNNKGIVRISEGSNLYLNSGSHLYIYSGSTLIIEKDATLFVENNTDIYIEEGATIEIKGRLYLSNNAIFKPNGAGLVIFNNANNTFGIAANSGSTIEFKSTTNETKLEISGAITIPSQLGMFKVDGAIVVANQSSVFNIFAPVYFENATFKPSTSNINNSWKGIVFNNQTDNQIHIDHSKFYNATTALDFSSDYALSSPSFYLDEFYNNTLAMSIHDAGFTLNNCIFQDNAKALNANWITMTSTLYGCKFKNNNIGIDYRGNINALLLLKNNNIIASNVYIVSPSSNPFLVTLKCNKFTSTDINIDFASVNLSSTTLHNTSDYGGFNIFKESPLGLNNVNNLNLKAGFNDFIATSGLYINASVTNANTASSSQCNNNYFDRINGGAYPLPNGITSNTYFGKLAISYKNSINQVTSNYKLFGTLASQQNGGCQAGGGGGFAPSIAQTENNNSATFTKLYPNPTTEQLNIEMAVSENASQIQVIDMQGKMVWNAQVAAGIALYTMPVKELPAGVYMLMLSHDSKVEKLRFAKH